MTNPIVSRLRVVLVVASLAAMVIPGYCATEEAQPKKSVLLLSSFSKNIPAFEALEAGLDQFLSFTAGKNDVYFEFMNGPRLPEGDVTRFLGEYLQAKYRSVDLDYVVGWDIGAIDFLIENPTLFRRVKRIYLEASAEQAATEDNEAPETSRIFVRTNFDATLSEINRIVAPEIVYVVGGEGELGLRPQLAAAAGRVLPKARLVYLDGLTLGQMGERLKRVDNQRAAAFYLLLFSDGEGTDMTPYAALERIAKDSAIPVFSAWEPLLGSGMVGGTLFSQWQMGKILGGALAKGEPLPSSSVISPMRIAYDWEGMRRWKIDAGLLPDVATVINRPENLWSKYKYHMLSAAFAFFLLLLLAAFLARVVKQKNLAILNLRKVSADDARHLAELEVAQERVELAAEGGDIAFWDFNPLADEAYFSSNLLTMLGYVPDEMEHSYTTWRSLLHPDDVEGTESQLQQHIQSGKPMSMEFRLRAKGGDWRYIRASGRIVERDSEGRAQRMCGVHHDVTSIRSLEEQLRQSQKMEALGTLAGGIAHDFNNMLGAILGYTELLLAGDGLTDKMRRRLQQVLGAARRARDLVKQILAFSRSGEQTREVVAVGQIVDETQRLLRRTIPANLPIQLDVRGDNLTVFADPTHLHQIIMNLGTNAYHAVRSGGGTIAIAVEAVDVSRDEALAVSDLEKGPYVRVTVSDTGTGMDPVVASRAMEPFFTTKGVGEGSGMGLAVAHGIVGSLGGAIAIRSALGEGTQVEVYLPRCTAEVENLAGTGDGTVPRGFERVLVVDDEPALRDVMRQHLTDLGYRVETVESSEQALATFVCSPGKFDVLITDQSMPGMTGDVLAREVLERRPGFPVVICTGYSDVLEDGAARAFGVKGFLCKPVERSELARTLREVLDVDDEEQVISGRRK